MTDTANLGLPCIEGSQAQKHVTHNEALHILDTLVQLAVIDRDLAAPPASPAEGQRWIVKTGATGAWTGHVNEIAAWQDGVWQFSTPRAGWLCYVIDEGALLAWNGSAWIDALAALTAINNMTLLGLCTAADATNPLSARLNSALFTARTVAGGGDGNLRYKLSKESAANTLSFLFQDNYSGRAEIGLTGDDNLHIKVSADGTTWREGIVVNRATGAVSFPNTTIAGGREVLTADRTYYVRTDGSDGNSGLVNSSSGAFATIQKAIDTTLTLDLGGHGVTIQVGAGTYTQGANVPQPFIGGIVTLLGDTTTPSNVVISPTAATCIHTTLKSSLSVGGFRLTTTSSGDGLQAENNSVINVVGKMEFGAVAGRHMSAFSSVINVAADYVISGGASAHVLAADLSTINDYFRAVTLAGTPAFSTAFAVADRLADMLLHGNTYSGSATGVRYAANSNSVIYTAGATLPGSSAGSASSGAQYS